MKQVKVSCYLKLFEDENLSKRLWVKSWQFEMKTDSKVSLINISVEQLLTWSGACVIIFATSGVIDRMFPVLFVDAFCPILNAAAAEASQFASHLAESSRSSSTSLIYLRELYRNRSDMCMHIVSMSQIQPQSWNWTRCSSWKPATDWLDLPQARIYTQRRGAHSQTHIRKDDPNNTGYRWRLAKTSTGVIAREEEKTNRMRVCFDSLNP